MLRLQISSAFLEPVPISIVGSLWLWRMNLAEEKARAGTGGFGCMVIDLVASVPHTDGSLGPFLYPR